MTEHRRCRSNDAQQSDAVDSRLVAVRACFLPRLRRDVDWKWHLGGSFILEEFDLDLEMILTRRCLVSTVTNLSLTRRPTCDV